MGERKGVVKIYDTSGKIMDLKGAKKYSQDMARLCYAGKSIEDIREEPFNSNLTDKGLIKSGHHSPFDHFSITYIFEGFSKAFAMTLNNERPYTTSEKSARYTQMSEIGEHQRELYFKWFEIFNQQIENHYPKNEFSRLYKPRRKGDKTPAEKLAQENARYMTSVFTPTHFSHTISLRQMNVLAGFFEDFIEENKDSPDLFKKRLSENYQTFLDAPEIQRFRIKDIRAKADFKLSLFEEPVEEHFGRSQYSVNQEMSFACLAQTHRHRTLENHINVSPELNLPLGVFVPPILRENNKLVLEWINDMESVAKYDFPQGQLIGVSELGSSKHLFMKSRERMCGHAQLEITRKTAELIDKYSKYVPEVASWKLPECHKKHKGECDRGGCNLGSELYLKRLI